MNFFTKVWRKLRQIEATPEVRAIEQTAINAAAKRIEQKVLTAVVEGVPSGIKTQADVHPFIEGQQGTIPILQEAALALAEKQLREKLKA